MTSDGRELIRREPHALPGGWSWTWLDNVFTFAGGAQPPSSEFIREPRPGYVRLVQIRDFYTDAHKTYVPDTSKLRKCDARDVMIARYGSAGGSETDSLGRICRGIAGAYNVALAKATPSAGIENDFLFYLLQSRYFQNPLRAMSARSVQSGFNREGLRTILLPVPPIGEQRAIADVLGALDDEIDSTAVVSRRCWALARAHYDRAVAAPTRVVALGEMLDLEYGKALPSSQRVPGVIRVYGSGGVVGWHDKALVGGPGIVVGRKGTVGAVHWSPSPFFPIDTTFFVRPFSGIPMSFAYFSLDSIGLRSMNFDSAVPGLNRAAALRRTVPLLEAQPLQIFDSLATALIERADAALAEAAALAQLRDTLLPALFSGELRVRDAEALVGEAV